MKIQMSHSPLDKTVNRQSKIKLMHPYLRWLIYSYFHCWGFGSAKKKEKTRGGPQKTVIQQVGICPNAFASCFFSHYRVCLFRGKGSDHAHNAFTLGRPLVDAGGVGLDIVPFKLL